MSLTPEIVQDSVPSEPSQAADLGLTGKPEPAPAFTTLPLELRLQIYGYVLSSTKHTLRRPAECSPRTGIKLFDTSLLSVSKQINAETVPILYASHTFHHAASDLSNFSSRNFAWLKHASIDISLEAGPNADSVLATQIQELDKSCPTLRTLTVHFTKSAIDWRYPSLVGQLKPQSLTATALQKLHPRLDKLSVVVYGLWRCMELFYESVAMDDSQWVDELLDSWPLISLDPVPPPPEPSGLGVLMVRANLWHGMPQEVYAYHLFTSTIAKMLQEGELDRRDWFFSSQ